MLSGQASLETIFEEIRTLRTPFSVFCDESKSESGMGTRGPRDWSVDGSRNESIALWMLRIARVVSFAEARCRHVGCDFTLEAVVRVLVGCSDLEGLLEETLLLRGGEGASLKDSEEVPVTGFPHESPANDSFEGSLSNDFYGEPYLADVSDEHSPNELSEKSPTTDIRYTDSLANDEIKPNPFLEALDYDLEKYARSVFPAVTDIAQVRANGTDPVESPEDSAEDVDDTDSTNSTSICSASCSHAKTPEAKESLSPGTGLSSCLSRYWYLQGCEPPELPEFFNDDEIDLSCSLEPLEPEGRETDESELVDECRRRYPGARPLGLPEFFRVEAEGVTLQPLEPEGLETDDAELFDSADILRDGGFLDSPEHSCGDNPLATQSSEWAPPVKHVAPTQSDEAQQARVHECPWAGCRCGWMGQSGTCALNVLETAMADTLAWVVGRKHSLASSAPRLMVEA